MCLEFDTTRPTPNIMTIFTKAVNVITSCDTWPQRRVAKNWLDLALKGNYITYQEYYMLFGLLPQVDEDECI